jgi:DNA repair exonuclease SbcCD ATPase subunit
MPYRGVTELILEPKSYAVVAHRVDNLESSNWAGKSSLLESIDFVLNGRLNADRKMGVDGWLSDGATEGAVLVEFDDGTVVERARKKSTQLYVTPKGGKTATKDEAQQMLDEMVGLSADDFVVTSYFRQRKLSDFILTGPERRMAHVRAWFQLSKLEDGEERIRTAAAALSETMAALEQHAVHTREKVKQDLGTFATLGDLEVHMRALEKKLSDTNGKVTRLQAVLANNAKLIEAKRFIEERKDLGALIHRLHTEMEAIDKMAVEGLYADAKKSTEQARQKRGEAYTNVSQKEKLALAQFDGHCPIAEMQCPVKDQINAQRARNADLSDVAQAAYKKARETFDQLEMQERTARGVYEDYQRRERELSDLKAKMTAGDEAYYKFLQQPEPADVEDLQARIHAAHQTVVELSTELEAGARRFVSISDGVSILGRLAIEIDRSEKKLATHREALVIFGKNGAQRRVAESALRTIQDNANAMLAECGIDLDVEIFWTREGAGAAKTCDTCGHPFPASRKVKACERCHTERGNLLVNKLDIMMSEQSGGAEDLVGAAIQLSASAWLRRVRGSRWSVVLIDEPFGQLDAVNRRAFSSHLAAMLSARYQISQSMIIAHHSSVLDALPGRIEITHDGHKSTAKVVA